MSYLRVKMPESLTKQLRVLAKKDKISVDQFVSCAVAEKMSALMTQTYLKDRASRGNRLAFERVLAKIPDVEPEPYDKKPKK